MKYLLDTHSFIWAITDLAKLSKKVRNIIEDPENEINVSIITFWEMSIKQSIGKISFGKYAVEDFIELADQSQFSTIGLSTPLVATSYRLPWRENHKDPFDRMIIWKAIQNDFQIISKDSDFLLYNDLGLKLIW